MQTTEHHTIPTSQEYYTLLRKLNRLQNEKLELAEQVKSLQAQNTAYRQRIDQLESKTDAKNTKTDEEILDQSDACIRADIIAIGFQVRLRFLEKHRERMVKSKPKCRRKTKVEMGNKAAHRGKPLVDAWVVEHGFMETEVYEDLYGVGPERLGRWGDVPQLVEVVGFRGSLRNAGVCSVEFEETYRCLLELEAQIEDPDELGAAVESIPEFAQYLQKLHVLYRDFEAAGDLVGSRRTRKAQGGES